MALSEDQAKIIVQILNSLKYNPQDGKDVLNIVNEVDKLIIDKTIAVPVVYVTPDTVYVKIEKKNK